MPTGSAARRISRTTTLVAGSLIAAGSLTACGGGTATVRPSDGADLVVRLARPKPIKVQCQNGVAAQVGNRMTCQVAYANGDRGRVLLTVAAIKGTKATLRIAGPSALHIETIGANAAEDYLATNIQHNTGSTSQIASIGCASNTADVVGHTIPCQVVFKDGHRFEVTVHVVNGRGGLFAGRGDVHRVR